MGFVLCARLAGDRSRSAALRALAAAAAHRARPAHAAVTLPPVALAGALVVLAEPEPADAEAGDAHAASADPPLRTPTPGRVAA